MAQFLGFPRPLKQALEGFKEKQITKNGSDLSGLSHCIPRKIKHKFGLAAVLLLVHSPSFIPNIPKNDLKKVTMLSKISFLPDFDNFH